MTCKRIAWGSNICVRSSSGKHLCSYLTYIVATKCSRNHFISEEYKTDNHLTLILLTWRIWWAANNASKWQMGFNSAFKGLSYTSSKTVPLCNYTILAATVKALETFMEANLWKTFQLNRRIRNDVSSITKARSFQCWFQSGEQVKFSCYETTRVWGVLHSFHIALGWEILD